MSTSVRIKVKTNISFSFMCSLKLTRPTKKTNDNEVCYKLKSSKVNNIIIIKNIFKIFNS